MTKKFLVCWFNFRWTCVFGFVFCGKLCSLRLQSLTGQIHEALHFSKCKKVNCYNQSIFSCLLSRNLICSVNCGYSDVLLFAVNGTFYVQNLKRSLDLERKKNVAMDEQATRLLDEISSTSHQTQKLMHDEFRWLNSSGIFFMWWLHFLLLFSEFFWAWMPLFAF